MRREVRELHTLNKTFQEISDHREGKGKKIPQHFHHLHHARRKGPEWSTLENIQTLWGQWIVV